MSSKLRSSSFGSHYDENLVGTGGVAARRGSDDTEPSQQSGDTQLAHHRDTRQPPHLAAPHQAGEGVRSWLLHVSNQLQCHEETSRMH